MSNIGNKNQETRIYGQPFQVDHIVVPVYLYASWAAVENILFSGQLKATLPEKCNDLCDMLPRWEDEYQRTRCMKEAWEYGFNVMFCFSLTPNSPAMWGHYADRGKGAVLRFDFPIFKKIDEQPFWEEATHDIGEPIMHIGTKAIPFYNEPFVGLSNIRMQKVQYKEERPKAFYLQNSYREYIDSLSTKGREWKYEKEVRIIMDRQLGQFQVHGGNYYSNELMQYFSGVSLGPMADIRWDYVHKLLESIPTDKSKVWGPPDRISVKYADISPSRYSIVSRWEESSEYIFEQIPEISMQTFLANFQELKIKNR